MAGNFSKLGLRGYGWPMKGKAVATIVAGNKAWVEQTELAGV